jgi:hypothetical protein
VEIFLLGLCLFISLGAYSEEPLYFTVQGRLFLVDASARSITLVASFHPAAPTVARAPDGRYWGRVGETFLGAYSPVSSQFVERVQLPFRPYNHVIAGNGKAYITHNTLTPEGFWMSVIDTGSGRLGLPIKNIEGLRTDLIEHNGIVYLATRDVKEDSVITLYRISTENDRISKLYKVHKPGYVSKLSVHGDSLYVCYMVSGRQYRPPVMEILDLASGVVTSKVEQPGLSEVRRLLGRMIFDADFACNSGLVPCIMNDGTYAIAVFDTGALRIKRVMRVKTPVHTIIDAGDQTILYLDNPMYVGREGVSLYFYNIEQETEVKVVNINRSIR